MKPWLFLATLAAAPFASAINKLSELYQETNQINFAADQITGVCIGDCKLQEDVFYDAEEVILSLQSLATQFGNSASINSVLPGEMKFYNDDTLVFTLTVDGTAQRVMRAVTPAGQPSGCIPENGEIWTMGIYSFEKGYPVQDKADWFLVAKYGGVAFLNTYQGYTSETDDSGQIDGGLNTARYSATCPNGHPRCTDTTCDFNKIKVIFFLTNSKNSCKRN